MIALSSLATSDQIRPSVWVADDDDNFLELFKVACGSIDLSEVFFATSGMQLIEMLEAFLNNSSYAVVF